MRPYTIAVCHQKGGVAKTSTVISLGATLVEHDKHTLMIDLDPTANLTAGAGLNPLKIRKSMVDVLLGNDTLTMVNHSTSLPGLDVVPASVDMTTAARFLHVRANYERLLRTSLAQNGLSAYDFVLLDCPPSLGTLTITALTAADLVIIPIQCEYFALQGMNTVFKSINKVREKDNPALRYRLLITMYDRRGKLHTEILDKLEAHYGQAIFEAKIGFDSKLRASQVAGIPITKFASSTRAAKQYRALASEILAYVQE